MTLDDKFKLATKRMNEKGFKLLVEYDNYLDKFQATVGNYDPEVSYTFDFKTPHREKLLETLNDVIRGNY